LQFASLPTSMSAVHGSPSSQSAWVTQGGPASASGSQVSPSSSWMMPSPQWSGQSSSLAALQLSGQQLSPSVQACASTTHSAWQLLPLSMRVTQSASGGQALGHAPVAPAAIATSHFSLSLT
jgi:hypothetical protein